MRASLLCAAFVTALAFTTISPSDAKAQVVITPSVSYYSPYGYTASSYYPGYYNYGYAYSNPYTGSWRYAWSNPYSWGNYGWYNANPYSSYYGYRNWMRPWRW